MGRASTTESFAEMNNGGFLALVLDDDEVPAGSVVWYRADEDDPVTVLGPDASALVVTLVGPDADDSDDSADD